MDNVIIVVPVYKNEFSLLEEISLRQAMSVLADYPIAFILPEKLRGFFEDKGFILEYFLNCRLESRFAYSKLLLDIEFYQRFTKYDFMLLYQLDAFVFSDKLKEFCSMNYDYIGAPMPYSCWRDIKCNVGNGGFSLRKISSCLRVLSQKNLICEMSGLQDAFAKAEDKFFGYCGANDAIDFTVPKVAVAESFAVEYNVAHSWQRISLENLPFGCHAWSKPQYFRFWKPYIERFINEHIIEPVERLVFARGKLSYNEWYFGPIYSYLNERFYRNHNFEHMSRDDKLMMLWKQIFPTYENSILWGYGGLGRRAFSLMKIFGENVVGIFDQKKDGLVVDEGLVCRLPDIDWALQRKCKIFVTTVMYEKEIINILQSNGMTKGEDFFLFKDFERDFIVGYYRLIWSNMK